MPSVDLYYVPTSPPCRAVIMTAFMVGVDVNLKIVDIFGGELMKPEFLKINRQHNVPTIDDNGFHLNESRAICAYLVNQYGHKVAHLYPEDVHQRGLIDERLNFDASVLFPSFRDTYIAVAMGRMKNLDDIALKPVHDGLDFLDNMLKDHNYVVGNVLTIADLSLLATVSSINASDDEILDKYHKVKAWLQRCQKEIKHYEALNGKGAQLAGQWIKQALKNVKN